MYWQITPPDLLTKTRNVINLVVAARRQMGWKTITTLEHDAPSLKLSPRQARRIFENDRPPFISLPACSAAVDGGKRVLRQAALKMRMQADRWDAEADALEIQQEQLDLWSDQECQSFGAVKPRVA